MNTFKTHCLMTFGVLAPLALTSSVRSAPLDAVSADRARIRAHLERVERELYEADTSALSPERFQERLRNINRLRAYRLRGEFPRNTGHPGARVPYFIDRDGRACAVGALMILSGAEPLARTIAADENNARLPDMRTPGIGDWVERSGLDARECARIQPIYCEEGLCADGGAPVCGKSGQSYVCRDILEQCSNDEFAHDGECLDAGEDPGEPGPVVTNDESSGCTVSTRPLHSPLPAWLALGVLLSLVRRVRCRDCAR